jgi:hypothetical protein
MADWIECELIVTGHEDDIKVFEEMAYGYVQRYRGDKESPVEALCFNHLIPVPAKLTRTYYTEKSYNWEIRNWGCKWGARHSKILHRSSDLLTYGFSVPNSLPINWLKKVSTRFGRMMFELCYMDNGVTHSLIFENGMVFDK